MIMGVFLIFFFFKQKTAYEIVVSDWSSDVCSSDLVFVPVPYFLDYCSFCSIVWYLEFLIWNVILAVSGPELAPTPVL